MKTSVRSLLAVGIITAALAVRFAFAEKKTPDADFVAHEWGTFTSVQGADGLQFDWNPFVAPDLPKFVYDIARPEGLKPGSIMPGRFTLSKISMTSRLRMETPVIYFYSDKERTVDVDVQFNGGRITEWYPQLTDTKAQNVQPVANANPFRDGGRMHWSRVMLHPGADGAKLFPNDSTRSHYYAARETDAVPLSVKAEDGTEQHEKFLFYRGGAGFDAPLRVLQSSDNADVLTMENTAKQPMSALFVLSVRGDRAALVPVAPLKAGESRHVECDFGKLSRPLSEVRSDIAAKMRTALVADGLYEKEAAAMVTTWDDSWFGEQGMRVLYTLPQQWTDGVLPLAVTPAPKEVRRVFVGRAELITPAMEWAVLRQVVRYAEGDETAKAAAIKAVQAMNLGRFTGPALSRVMRAGPQVTEFRRAVSAMIESIRPVAPKSLAKAN